MAKIYEDNSFAIGNTPLVKLKSVTKTRKLQYLQKLKVETPLIVSNAGSAQT